MGRRSRGEPEGGQVAYFDARLAWNESGADYDEHDLQSRDGILEQRPGVAAHTDRLVVAPVSLYFDMPSFKKPVRIDEIGARFEVLKMTTATTSGGGHRAHATVRLTWDDGASETHEGDLGLVFHSRGYRFRFDGLHSGGLEVKGPSHAETEQQAR